MSIREYETIFILRPDLGEDAITKLIDRVRGIIDAKGGKLFKEENWGKKRLAYEVKKHLKGTFCHLVYVAPPGIVEEIERTFKMIETVIKFQTVKVSDNIDLEKRLAEIEDEKRKRREEEEVTKWGTDDKEPEDDDGDADKDKNEDVDADEDKNEDVDADEDKDEDVDVDEDKDEDGDGDENEDEDEDEKIKLGGDGDGEEDEESDGDEKLSFEPESEEKEIKE